MSARPTSPPLTQFHWQSLSPYLTRWAELGNAPPSLLLTGAPGVGKRAVALRLAQWFMCEVGPFTATAESDSLFGSAEPAARSQSTEPCDVCPNCRRALSGQWLDFVEIALDPEESASTIGVDRLRELKGAQGFGAYGGGLRVFLIRDAERMTPAAANSLLKILEEPPVGWVILLTASDPSLLLPTLLSRCQKLRLRPLPNDVLLECLREAAKESGDASRLHEAVLLSQGSLGRAEQLLTDDALELRQLVKSFFTAPARHLEDLTERAARSEASFELLLDFLELTAAEPLAPAPPEGTVWYERLFEARKRARLPLNKRVLAQSLLVPWLTRI